MRVGMVQGEDDVTRPQLLDDIRKSIDVEGIDRIFSYKASSRLL